MGWEGGGDLIQHGSLPLYLPLLLLPLQFPLPDQEYPCSSLLLTEAEVPLTSHCLPPTNSPALVLLLLMSTHSHCAGGLNVLSSNVGKRDAIT